MDIRGFSSACFVASLVRPSLFGPDGDASGPWGRIRKPLLYPLSYEG